MIASRKTEKEGFCRRFGCHSTWNTSPHNAGRTLHDPRFGAPDVVQHDGVDARDVVDELAGGGQADGGRDERAVQARVVQHRAQRAHQRLRHAARARHPVLQALALARGLQLIHMAVRADMSSS